MQAPWLTSKVPFLFSRQKIRKSQPLADVRALKLASPNNASIKVPVKRWLLILLQILAAPAAFSRPGFWSLKDAPVTDAVKNAARSVVRISMYTDDPTEIISAQHLNDYIESYCKADADFGDQIACKLLTACKKQAPAQDCPIPYVGVASAVVVEDEKTLWTVAHNFHYLREKNPSGILKQQEIKIVIFDGNDREIFNSWTGNDRASVEILADQSQLEPKDLDAHREVTVDFGKLLLSRSLGIKPITVRDSPATSKESLAILGFPGSTEGRLEEYNAPDSTGLGLQMSLGRQKKISQFLFDWSSKEAPNYQIMAIDESALALDADGSYGGSGGAIVDMDGKLVGIFSRHASFENFAVNERYHHAGALGLKISRINELIKILDQPALR